MTWTFDVYLFFFKRSFSGRPIISAPPTDIYSLQSHTKKHWESANLRQVALTLILTMGSRRIFLQGTANDEPSPEGPGRGGVLGKELWAPSPARVLGSAVSSPAGSGAQPRRKKSFLYNFWPLDDHCMVATISPWSPVLAYVVNKIWGQLALAFQSQSCETRPVSPRSPSKYEYNIQFFHSTQKWNSRCWTIIQNTIFLHGTAASRRSIWLRRWSLFMR